MISSFSSATASASIYSPSEKKDILQLSKKIFNCIQGKKLKLCEIKEICSLQPEDLEALLTEFMKQLSEGADYEKSLKAISNLAGIIPIESLQKAILKKYPDQTQSLFASKKMFEEAKQFLEVSSEKTGSKNILISAIDSMIALLEGLLNIFGVEEIFKPHDSEMEAQFKLGRVMMLASLFMMLSASILPLYGVETGGMIVGGSMIVLAILSVIYPKIRSKTKRLPEGINLTQEIENGKHKTISGREDVVQKIAEIFASSTDKMTSHAMLIGKSGMGKTQTVHALAHAIHNGTLPKLIGKMVIYFNMADIANNKDFIKGGNKVLQQIAKLIENNRKNYILVFDEIHMACRSNSVIADQLKKYLDPQNTDSFPFVIGMTTNMEFYGTMYKHNPALARRFNIIPIEKMQEDETLEILTNYMLQTAPNVLLEKGILKHLLTETNKTDAVQPGSALRILAECAKLISLGTTQSSKKQEIERAKARLKSLYAQGLLDPFDSSRSTRIEDIENQLKELEKEQAKHEILLGKLNKNRQLIWKLKKSTNINIIKSQKKGSKSELLLKQVLLSRFFLTPILENLVRKQGKDLGVKVSIDEELVKQVIDAERINQEQVTKMVEEGKKEENDRR